MMVRETLPHRTSSAPCANLPAGTFGFAASITIVPSKPYTLLRAWGLRNVTSSSLAAHPAALSTRESNGGKS
jgi:hypothetical protein